jgi:hypothetical protein
LSAALFRFSKILSQAIERSSQNLRYSSTHCAGLFQRLGLELHFMNSAHSAGGAAIPPSPAPADVSKPPQRHCVPSGQTGDAAITLRQLGQDPPPRRIGQAANVDSRLLENI